MKNKELYKMALKRKWPDAGDWVQTRFLAAALLLSGALSAQNGVSRQPLPAFKYRADNGADTII